MATKERKASQPSQTLEIDATPHASSRTKARLREHYQKNVVPALIKDFSFENVMAVPRIEKVTINIGMGEATGNQKLIDGAVQELATAVQFKIGVVTLVFNNNAYGNVRRDQRERFAGRVVASDLVNPDFVKLAESFDVGAARVTSPDHFRAALEKALAHGGPYLIDIEVPTDSETTPWTFIHPAKP